MTAPSLRRSCWNGMRAGAKSQGNISSRIRIVSGDSSVGARTESVDARARHRPLLALSSDGKHRFSASFDPISRRSACLGKTTPQSADRTQTQSLAWSISRLLGSNLKTSPMRFFPAGRRENLKAERTSQMFERCCEGKAPAQWSSIYANPRRDVKSGNQFFTNVRGLAARAPCRGAAVEVIQEVVTF